jgi:hypothetical protein
MSAEGRKVLSTILGFLLIFLATVGIVYALTVGSTDPTRVDISSDVTFFHDELHQVGCWVYKDFNAGGISCLPDDQYAP